MSATDNKATRAALLEEIVRLQTRVAQLEAVAMLDRAPFEAAPAGGSRPDARFMARQQRYEQLLAGVTTARS